MQSYYLDSYQKKVEEATGTGGTVICTGQKMSGKSFLLSEICRRQRLNGKRVFMVVSNVQQALLLQKKLRRFLFTDQALVFDPVVLQDEQIHKLIARIKSNEISFDENDFAGKELKRAELTVAIKNHFEKLNKVLLVGKTWHELVVLNAFDRHSMETLHFNPLFRIGEMHFTQQEYDRLAEIILKARQFYERSEAHVDTFFKEDIYRLSSGIQAWSEIMEWVAEMRKSCVNKLISVGLFFNERINLRLEKSIPFSAQGQVYLERTKVQLQDYLTSAVTHIAAGPGKSILRKPASQTQEMPGMPELLTESFMKTIQIFRQIPGFSVYEEDKKLLLEGGLDAGQLEQKLAVLSEFLEVFPSYVRDFAQKETGKLNIHATDDPALVKLSEELESFYRKLQESKILNKTFEPAAFNLDKHLKQLESILKQLNEVSGKADLFIKCFAFNQFYFSHEPNDRLLIQNMLYLSPKDWTVFFKNWYIQNIIEQNGHFLQKVTTSSLQEFLDLELNLIRLAQLRELRSASAGISRSLESMENKNSRLYRQLVNKNVITVEDWHDIVHRLPEFLWMLFPVLIIPAVSLGETPSVLKTGADIILFDLEDASYETHFSEISQLLKTEIPKVIALEEGDPGLSRLVSSCKPLPMVFELKGYHQQGLMELREMNHTERLYGARNLAHLIRDVAPQIEIFKMENTIIYSCLSGPLNELILAMLDQKGIKKMRILETPFNLLLENLLDIQNRHFLLTQDGLLNSASFNDIQWQMYILWQAEKAGIKVIDLNTLDLKEAPVKVFSSFIESNLMSDRL